MVEKNGFVTTEMVEKAGFPRVYLSRLLKQNKIKRVQKGFYTFVDSGFDAFVLYSYLYKKCVFSRRTALYLQGLLERSVDAIEANFPRTYNVSEVTKDLKCYRVSGIRYSLGVVEVESPHGNMIPTYDKEKALCDMFLYELCDTEEVQYALKAYLRGEHDTRILYDYAKRLGIYDRISLVIEVLI